MNMKLTMALAASLAFMPSDAMPSGPVYKSKPEWKPEFTEEELNELRALPKKEREKRVKQLRAIYLQRRNGK